MPPAEPRKWTPQTQTQASMDRQYRAWSPTRRMEHAAKKHLEDDWSQAEAARRLGVSRSRLNEKIKAIKAAQAEQQARSEVTRTEKLAEFEPVPEAPAEAPALGVANERRRVPPFEKFVEMYFGNLECPDCGKHHELPDFHREMMGLIEDPGVRRLLVNIPPFHAKSQITTTWSTVYELCRDPNSRTAIVSKSQRLAKRFVYQIQKHLTDHALYTGGANLIDDWGPFVGDSWSKEEFYVAGREGSEKDPSVSAYGVGAQIYGYRFDRMIFDDIADLENQKNPERVTEMFQWATQECASRVGKAGKQIYVGTRVSPGDIYSYLKDLPAYQVFRRPCITDDEAKLTLWPDHFPYSSASQQRDSMSYENWQLAYQNIDAPGFGASFTPEILERARSTDHHLGAIGDAWALIIGLDPAGANKQSGYTALVCLAVDLQDGRRYLVDIVNAKQLKAPQLRDQLFEWADRYPIRELRVESNGLQSQLVQYNQEIQARFTNRGIRVVPHITTKHNKWDPQFGVESMAPMYYNGQITVPWGDINSRAKVGELEEQLLQFPMGSKSDLVMALWFAELGCRELFQRHTVPQFDPRFKVPGRIRRNRRVIDFAEKVVRPPTQAEERGVGGLFTPDERQPAKEFVNVPGTVPTPA